MHIALVKQELEVPSGFEGASDQMKDLASGDGAGVGNVIGTERRASFPEFEASADAIVQVREGIDGVSELQAVLELRKEVRWFVLRRERKTEPPDVGLIVADGLFGEGLGAAIEVTKGGLE